MDLLYLLNIYISLVFRDRPLTSTLHAGFFEGFKGLYLALRLSSGKDECLSAGLNSILCSKIRFEDESSFWSRWGSFWSTPSDERSAPSTDTIPSEERTGIAMYPSPGHYLVK